jgi:arylsulfatase
VQNDRLVIDYNAFDEHVILESDIEVPAGESTVLASFRRGDGKVGSMSVAVNGVDL